MSGANEPHWVRAPPSAFSIVACWYPEDDDANPGPTLRPALVTAVLAGKTAGLFACKVAFGTRTLKLIKRGHVDLIIEDGRHLRQMGLHRPTRFDLDQIALLPWSSAFFGCWSGYSSPILGSLLESYVKDYAFLIMRRGSA